MKQLIKHIRSYVSLSEAEAAKLAEELRVVPLRKKDLLLSNGRICRSTWFVSRGCLRMYFIGKNGTEQITQFAIENWWLTDYMSLTTGSPSEFFIEAVEDTTVIELDTRRGERLFDDIPQLERYFRLILQRTHAAAQFRIKYLYDFSREELYRHFKTNFPDFVQRVPQYMLASYLGFTPEYLSELRKKEMQ